MTNTTQLQKLDSLLSFFNYNNEITKDVFNDLLNYQDEFKLSLEETIKVFMFDFWNNEYKHYMRDLKPSYKYEVYKELKDWDLELDGKSDLHLELIQGVIGDYTINGEDDSQRIERLENAYI